MFYKFYWESLLEIVVESGKFIDRHEGLFAAVIGVVGWIIVYSLGIRQQNKLLKNQIKKEIYEEISAAYSTLTKKFGIDLAVELTTLQLSRALSAMELCEKGTFLHESFTKPYEYWIDYTKKLVAINSDAQDSVTTFLGKVDGWINAMPDLQESVHLLWKQTQDFFRKTSELSINLTLKYTKSDWHNWRKEGIESEFAELKNSSDELIGYFEDLMTLIHNSLLSQVFPKKRLERNLFHLKSSIKYKALTKFGIKERTYIPKK